MVLQRSSKPPKWVRFLLKLILNREPAVELAHHLSFSFSSTLNHGTHPLGLTVFKFNTYKADLKP